MDFLPEYAPEYKFATIVLYLKKYSSKREFRTLVELVYYKIFKFYTNIKSFQAVKAERDLVNSMTDTERRELAVDNVMQRLGEQKPDNFKIIVRAAIFVAANWWMCNDRCLTFDFEELLKAFD